jgi:hypothetical protein
MQKIKNFACIIYAESENRGWKEAISEFGLPYFWILHDKDAKKPHFHVLFCPCNAISINTAKHIVELIGGANGRVERVASKRGYMRYLTHMDNPEKYQYPTSDIVFGCGACYDFEHLATKEELRDSELDILQEMIEYIDANNVYLYCDFVRTCVTYHRDWFRVLSGAKGRVIDKYIKSLYWAKQQNI